MQVRHKIKAVVGIGSLRPVLDGSQIAAQCQIPGGLNAGKHPLLGCFLDDFAHKITLLSLKVFLMISQLPPLCKEILRFHLLQN